MYWFVIYAARCRTRARVKDPDVGPPSFGNWVSCPAPAADRGRPLARYAAILGERDWTALCQELGLDLEQACRAEGRAQVCEAGPLPALLVDQQLAELPGIIAAVLDMPECAVDPFAAIALEMAVPSATSGGATDLEVSLCVAPLAESDAERKWVRSLFAAVAFNVGGADAELRCPNCVSPELRWIGGPNIEEQMGCGNCGARLAREAAFITLGDCEEILATAPQQGIAAAATAPGAP